MARTSADIERQKERLKLKTEQLNGRLRIQEQREKNKVITKTEYRDQGSLISVAEG